MNTRLSRAVVGGVSGVVVFLALAWLLKAGLVRAEVSSIAVSQVALKGALIAVALGGWAAYGKPWSGMGWRHAGWGRWQLRWFAIGALAMIGGSVAMVLMNTRHPLASKLGFLQVVALIWVLSSVSEEIYVRGFWQSWMNEGREADPGASALDPTVVSSALLFAGMHVPLMWSEIGVAGGLAIVLATLGVGWACAVLRARSGGLRPAIACHVLANVAGVPGGVIGVVLYRVLFGRLPDMVTAMN